MKKHSLFSHLFWITTAIICGVLVFYSVAKGAKFVYGSLNQPEENNSDIFLDYNYDYKEQVETKTIEIISEPSRKKIYSIKKSSDLSKISSESYLVSDIDTGEKILNKNENDIMPIASITKLITALVSLETIDQFHQTKVSVSAASVPSIRNGDLREGQSSTMSDLIYPLLMESSNVAAETIAETYERKNFINKMNDKALSLGMSATFFNDPTGLSEKNVSTANDLFKLISFEFKNKNYILKTTQKKEHQTSQGVWTNNNKFSGMDNFLGGKTGYTEVAGKTFAGIFSVKLINNETRNIAIILLKSKDREDDVIRILDYIKTNISYE